MTKKATLLAFAGLDGSGKTTQAMRLTDRLARAGWEAVYLPNTSLAPIRRLLDDIAVRRGHVDHVALLGAETARLIAAVVKWTTLSELPELVARPDRVVIMDRAVACQYAALRAHGASNEALVREVFAALPRPDLTIMLEVPAELAARRVRARGRGVEELDALHRLRAAYRSLPEFSQFLVIDGAGGEDEVHETIVRALAAQLPRFTQVFV